jgi:hypothetical protein
MAETQRANIRHTVTDGWSLSQQRGTIHHTKHVYTTYKLCALMSSVIRAIDWNWIANFWHLPNKTKNVRERGRRVEWGGETFNREKAKCWLIYMTWCGKKGRNVYNFINNIDFDLGIACLLPHYCYTERSVGSFFIAGYVCALGCVWVNRKLCGKLLAFLRLLTKYRLVSVLFFGQMGWPNDLHIAVRQSRRNGQSSRKRKASTQQQKMWTLRASRGLIRGYNWRS